MDTFTFTWREFDGGDFFETSIPANTEEEAHNKWSEWANGFWETDISLLAFFICKKEV